MTPIEAVEHHLDKAVTYADIFGADDGSEVIDIGKRFHLLARSVHPDRVSDKDKSNAERVFAKLVNFRDRAKIAIAEDTGLFWTPFRTFQLKSRRGDYKFEEAPYAKGAYSIVYRGTFGGGVVVAKIANHPTKNTILESEARLLRRRNASDTPMIVDDFYVDKGGRRYRVNVMPLRHGLFSVADVVRRSIYTDPRDAAWMGRRIIGMAIAAEELGVVHGAITGYNVLLHPTSHDPLYIGWSDAKPIKKCNDADRTLDVFQAACLYSAFGTPPAKLIGLMERCFGPYEERPTPSEMMIEFTHTVRLLWGTVYRPFTLNQKER